MYKYFRVLLKSIRVGSQLKGKERHSEGRGRWTTAALGRGREKRMGKNVQQMLKN